MVDLEKLNNTFKDVTFKENTHQYLIKGKLAKYSVTQLLHEYQKPFEARVYAANVAKRDGFSVEEVLERWNFEKEYSCHKGTVLHSYAEHYLLNKKSY